MTTAVTTQQNPVAQPTRATDIAKYDFKIALYALHTILASISNPVLGAAYGASCVADIAINAAVDKLGWNENDALTRVTKAALAAIVGFVAGFAVLSVLGGSILASSAVVPLATTVITINATSVVLSAWRN